MVRYVENAVPRMVASHPQFYEELFYSPIATFFSLSISGYLHEEFEFDRIALFKGILRPDIGSPDMRSKIPDLVSHFVNDTFT